MTIKSTFLGLDGSLGFRNGKEYDLWVDVLPTGQIKINNRSNPEQVCVYNTFWGLSGNWSNAKNLERKMKLNKIEKTV